MTLHKARLSGYLFIRPCSQVLTEISESMFNRTHEKTAENIHWRVSIVSVRMPPGVSVSHRMVPVLSPKSPSDPASHGCKICGEKMVIKVVGSLPLLWEIQVGFWPGLDQALQAYGE